MRNNRPPLVVIQSLIAGGKRYATRSGIALPERTRALQIDFTALGLSIPERMRFRYQLIGNDVGWQDVGPRRETFYTNLRPGSYRFHVIAANEDGRWNQTGAALDFTIPPSFTESRWFLALWVTALGCVAWLLYRLHLRRVAGRLRARYQVALAERTRIAQDLHDTLLQGFTGVSLQVLAAAGRVAGPPEAIKTLRGVVELAQRTLADARQAIWDIRSADLEKQSLAEALESAARSAMKGTDVELTFRSRGHSRRLAPGVETTALRVGREAILNALKHSAAHSVEVDLEYAPLLLTLRVRDDGQGMPSGAIEAASAAGHWGVAGMSQRARLAGGTLEISSSPGHGTVVLLALPLERADG